MGVSQSVNPIFDELNKTDDDIRNKIIFLQNTKNELTHRIIMIPNESIAGYLIKKNDIRPPSGDISPTKGIVIYGREEIDDIQFTNLLMAAGFTPGEITALLTL